MKGGTSVLLVEDNLVNQRVATLQLRRLGLDVTVVGNGRVAVEMFQPERFGFILMDCQMPEMDGFEATRAIRAIESGSGIRTPIIAMTANALAGDRDACLAAGMDDYLAKPVKLQELEHAMNQWLPEHVDGTVGAVGADGADGADDPSMLDPNDESGEAVNAPPLLDQNTLVTLLSLGGDDDTELV